MKYILLIYDDPKTWASLGEAGQQEMMAGYRKVSEELKASGQYVAGSQLQPTSAATSLKVRGGKRMLTDGPFAETREQLGGYYIVDTENLDDAIAVAARIPGARWGTVEVRPILEIPGLPEE